MKPTRSLLPAIARRCCQGIVGLMLLVAASLALHKDGLAEESAALVRGVPNDAQRVVLSGNVHPLAQPRFEAGAVPAGLPMVELKLILRRSPQQDAALKKFLAAQQTPGSPQYHQWLTPAQFGARFGASQQDQQAATEWLQKHSFTVGTVPPGRGLLPFSGTAAQVETAFQTPIHYFIVDGVKHFANTANPSIPAAFQQLVSGISGLHDFRPHSNSRRRTSSAPAVAFENGGNAVLPQDFAVIYDLVPLLKGGISGTGVTVAIAAQSDIDPSVLTTYWSAFGVYDGQQFSSVAASAASDPGRTHDGNETEAYLDVEILGGLAPGAKIVLVRDKAALNAADYAVNQLQVGIVNISFSQCESALGSENSFVNSLYQQAAAQGITVVVSTGDSGIAECDDNIRAQSGMPVVSGLSVNGFASTPYNIAVGGTDFNPILVQEGNYWNTNNSPNTYANAQSYIPEMVWNTSCANPITAAFNGDTDVLAYCNSSTSLSDNLVEISGAGGGVSTCVTVSTSGVCTQGYTQPPWQTGVAGLQGLTARAIPDVAILANDWIICDQTVSTCGSGAGGYVVLGGTSAAAPAISGIVALLDQAMNGNQGNLNPTLYKLAAAEYGTSLNPNSGNLMSCNANNGASTGAACVFHDVTSGSNAQPCSVSKYAAGKSSPASTCISASGDPYGIVGIGSTDSYQAGPGYDLASGLGSISAANFVQAVTGMQAPSALMATPTGTSVTLSWSPIANATNYDVYSGTASGAEGSTPIATSSGTSTTVGSLAAGLTYYFYVTATTSSGTSLPSNEVNATLVPAAPTGLTTSGNANTITLTWTGSTGAASYYVLQGNTAGGESPTPAATGLTATSYSVTAAAGTTDYFEVVAVNQGGDSAASSEVSGTVLPLAPTALTATGGNASVSLTWGAGTGATSYNVYEGPSAGKETTTPVMTNVTGTTATIGGLANTTKYYFVVTSVNSAGTSAQSNEASATTITPSSGGGSLQLFDLAVGIVLLLGRYRRLSVACFQQGFPKLIVRSKCNRSNLGRISR